jgi:DNA polymerase V
MDTITHISIPNPSPEKTPCPIFISSLACGFPSPADEFVEQITSLDDIAINSPASTFFVRAGGNSMNGAGIYQGDVIIVDRAITPRHNDIVVACIDGEFTCKRLLISRKQITLKPENPEHNNIVISEHNDFFIWGVCSFNLHNLRHT